MPRKGSASKGGKQKRGSKAAVKKEKGAGKAAKNPSEFTSAYGTHSTVRVNSRLDIWWQGEGQWVPCKVVDRSGDAGVGRSRRATRTSSTCDVTVQYDDGTHTHHLAIEPGGSHKLQGHKAVRKARGVLELVPWRPSQNEPFGFDNAVQPGDLIRVYWSKPPPWTTGSDTTSASNRTRGSWHRGTVVDIGEAQCHQTLGESQPGVIRYDIGSRQEDDSTSAKSEDAETIKERVLILHDFSKERWEKLRTTRRRRSSSSTTDVHQNLGSSSSTPPKPSAASNEKKTALRKRSSSASSTPSSARSHRRSVSRKNSMESSPTSPASKSTKSSTSTSSSSSSSTSSASRKKRGASPHVASSSKPAKLGESSPRFSKASSLAASCTAFLNFAIGAAKTVLHPNLTTAPETMPGRTAEHLRLRQFLDACLQGKGQGNNIYLGGRPGTGKTATVKKICTELLREQQGWTGAARALRSPKSAASSSSGKKRKSKSKRESRTVRGVSSSGNTGPGAINRQIMTVLEVNSARDIVQPGDIFEVVRALLQQELQAQGLPPSALLRGDGSGTAKSPGAAKTMLEHYFCGNGARSKAALKRRGMVVLVVDEMENLLGTADMNSNVLHPLFEWARRRESRLILVGISNEIELIEQYVESVPLLQLCRFACLKSSIRMFAARNNSFGHHISRFQGICRNCARATLHQSSCFLDPTRKPSCVRSSKVVLPLSMRAYLSTTRPGQLKTMTGDPVVSASCPHARHAKRAHLCRAPPTEAALPVLTITSLRSNSTRKLSSCAVGRSQASQATHERTFHSSGKPQTNVCRSCATAVLARICARA